MKIEIVTTLKREATRILAGLHMTREPLLITEHGKPSAYLVGADDFEMIQERMQIFEGIARGERAILENCVLTHAEAKLKMKKWLS